VLWVGDGKPDDVSVPHRRRKVAQVVIGLNGRACGQEQADPCDCVEDAFVLGTPGFDKRAAVTLVGRKEYRERGTMLNLLGEVARCVPTWMHGLALGTETRLQR
jgi:hypothetical protein